MTAIAIAVIFCTAWVRSDGGYDKASGWYIGGVLVVGYVLFCLSWRDVVAFMDALNNKNSQERNR